MRHFFELPGPLRRGCSGRGCSSRGLAALARWTCRTSAPRWKAPGRRTAPRAAAEHPPLTDETPLPELKTCRWACPGGHAGGPCRRARSCEAFQSCFFFSLQSDLRNLWRPTCLSGSFSDFFVALWAFFIFEEIDVA